jgi:hypothetical protein
MNVGEVYYTQLKSNLFIPLLEKDIDGNVFGMLIMAGETYQDMPLFGKYDKPYQYTTTKKAIERMTKLRNESRIAFRKMSSDEVNKYVPFYTPSSKMWLAVGDKYEKIISTSSSSVGKVYTLLGFFQHEDYVDYKTGKGVNPLYYPFGTDFSNLIAYVKGLAMTKSGLDGILISIPHTKDYVVVDTYAETMFNMFANDSELASWSINNPRPYNIVVIKKDPPKFTRQMLDVEVEIEKDEKKTLDRVKKLIGDDIDEEFIKKIATLDWDKLTKLKKKNPKILEEVAKTLGNIYQTYKQEREEERKMFKAQRETRDAELQSKSPIVDLTALKNWNIDEEPTPILQRDYEYKGFSVVIQGGDSSDSYRDTYILYKGDDYLKHIDWSGYGITFTEGLFRLYIDLGAPDRYHPALEENRKLARDRGESVYYNPLNEKDLITIKDYIISQDKGFESLLSQSDFTPPPINPVAIKNWINQVSKSVESKGYEYKGYKVMLEDVLDGKEVKTNYYIIDPNGFSKPALWNEVQIGQNIVRLYIDLGAPDNIANESELFEAREKFLNQYEEGGEKEDVSELTEIPESWWTKIDVEDFGYDKIDSSNEILDIINKKRRSKEDKIRLTLLFCDIYVINEDDERYEDFIDLSKKLRGSDFIKGKYPNIYRVKIKTRIYDKYKDELVFSVQEILQASPLPSDEWILDIPFTNIMELLLTLKSESKLGEILLVVSEINNLLISGTKKSTKPKSEIQTKYEKIDFDF